MPKVSYSDKEREEIRKKLVSVCLELIARQGIQHTTVEQIYKEVGISRTFFYSFFPAKEDLIVESFYLQQPKVIQYAKKLMAAFSWREAATKFFMSCCYGEKNGIAVLTIEEQQLIFKRLSEESYKIFRQNQKKLFGELLEIFGVKANNERINLFTNLCLAVMIVRRAIPENLPLFVPEAADKTAEVQIKAIVDWLESLKE